jgi:hypothetical protein
VLYEKVQLEWYWLVAAAVANCCGDAVSACGLFDVLCLKVAVINVVVDLRVPSAVWIGR